MDETELPKRFGAVVRRLCAQQDISQERLATIAGIDRAYMGGIERGQRNPTLTTVERVARGLGIKMSELIAAVERGE